MVIELCSCDWGLGSPLPAHEHAVMTLIRREDDDRPMWVRGFIPQRGWEVVAEVEELFLNVPWKQLAREHLIGVA